MSNESNVHSLVFGVSHIDVPVTDVARSARFYMGAFGFTRRDAGAGWVDLDASSICVRLIELSARGRRTCMRVQVADPANVLTAVVEAGGRSLYEPVRTPDRELVANALDPDGNTITLWRPLTEDEFDYIPDLPIEREWSPDAVELLKSLLLAVPAIFRGLARRKVVNVVEELVPAGLITQRDVVRGYILASAKITRGRLRAPLQRHGFDPDAFREEFEAE